MVACEWKGSDKLRAALPPLRILTNSFSSNSTSETALVRSESRNENWCGSSAHIYYVVFRELKV
jgi:hypothetical protein